MANYMMKQRLQARQPVAGTMITECLSPEVVAVLAAGGLDFFIIDTEHSPANLHQIEAMARASRQFGIAPLVRVTDNEYSQIARSLDCGAAGIVVPRIQSAADARRAVEAAKFPPLGRRGFWMRGILTDYSGEIPADGIVRANQETIVVVQVENAEALADVENIVRVPGIDALLVGPADLSMSLGILGQMTHERMKQAYRRVLEVCAGSPVVAGIHLDDAERLAEFAAQGFVLLDYSCDLTLMLKALKEGVQLIKAGAACRTVQGGSLKQNP